MRIFIAEKPSLGKAIAAVLPGPQQRHKTHIVSGEANVVVWCAGHILEQFYPEDYDPALKKWALGDLPIEPQEWQLKVSARTRDLYQTIKRFSKEATLIVHAGDPDREGQLLVDEVLAQLGVSVPVKRLLISDLNAAAVKKALGKLEDNDRYTGLRDAALGRSQADWLYGLNLTRLYTLQGQAGGHSGVLSVGRVQTPVLGLVVRRDREIEAFQSKPFYRVTARVEADGGAFEATWYPGENTGAVPDEHGRVVERAFPEALAARLQGNPGTVVDIKRQHKKEAPPLPFSLPELQKAAARGRGLSPRKTLDVAQSLYEKHQVLTYPRSDCRYLPADHWAEAQLVRDAILQSVGPGGTLASMADTVDLIHRGKCWNDQNVTAHHAIIPTTQWVPLDRLTADENWLYLLVAHRYLLQFCVDREYDQTDVRIHLMDGEGTEAFKTRGRVETEPGWTLWKGVLVDKSPSSSSESDEDDESTLVDLPPLAADEAVRCIECHLVEKHTTPPKRFTEASLLDAMTGIARYVSDPEIKQTLKETDGLGTPATQATILESLFHRGFLEKEKKQVLSTPLGRDLIELLPEPVSLPDMTAHWEQQLSRIEAGEMALADFMASVAGHTRSLVKRGKDGGPLSLAGAVAKATTEQPQSPCPREGCEGRLRRIKGKKGFFWGCTNYQGGCRETRPDSRGKPGKIPAARKAVPPARLGKPCPLCQKGTVQRRAFTQGHNTGKAYKGCSGFPGCRYFARMDAEP